MISEFSRIIFSKNFKKTSPVEAEFFHADGQTDMTELIIASRNFANAPKNGTYSFTESLRGFCSLGWRKFCFRREVCTANKRCLTRSSVSDSDPQLVGESSLAVTRTCRMHWRLQRAQLNGTASSSD